MKFIEVGDCDDLRHVETLLKSLIITMLDDGKDNNDDAQVL